jgi:plasmid stability protein
MPTLYVENVPKDLYQALRKRARENRNSIAAEVISLLERNIPTAEELRQRREFYDRIARSRTSQAERGGPFPTVEEMIREDRDR